MVQVLGLALMILKWLDLHVEVAADDPGMFVFMCESGYSAVDGLEMVDFIGESSCFVAGGLKMVEIGSSDVDGLEMGVCNGCMCRQL